MFRLPMFKNTPKTFDEIVEPLKTLVSDLQAYREAQAARISEIQEERIRLNAESSICVSEMLRAGAVEQKLSALFGEG